MTSSHLLGLRSVALPVSLTTLLLLLLLVAVPLLVVPVP